MSLPSGRKAVLYAAAHADTRDDMMHHLLKAPLVEMDGHDRGTWKRALAYISANSCLIFQIRMILFTQQARSNRELVRYLMDSVTQRIRILVTQTYTRQANTTRLGLSKKSDTLPCRCVLGGHFTTTRYRVLVTCA